MNENYNEYLEKFGTTPMDEPEIYKVFIENKENVQDTMLSIVDLVEERIGTQVEDYDFLGLVMKRVFGLRDDEGNFKHTPNTENIEPLKPRDGLAFLKYIESEEATQDDMIEWLKERTNIPDDLHQWEKKLIIEEQIQYAVDGTKTFLGGALGN